MIQMINNLNFKCKLKSINTSIKNNGEFYNLQFTFYDSFGIIPLYSCVVIFPKQYVNIYSKQSIWIPLIIEWIILSIYYNIQNRILWICLIYQCIFL